MAGTAKKIITAAGVAATAGLAAAAIKKKRDAAATIYHVKPAGDGWSVQSEGAERALSRHPNKKAAVAAGREVARGKAPSRLVIHGADGAVQRSHDYEG